MVFCSSDENVKYIFLLYIKAICQIVFLIDFKEDFIINIIFFGEFFFLNVSDEKWFISGFLFISNVTNIIKTFYNQMPYALKKMNKMSRLVRIWTVTGTDAFFPFYIFKSVYVE